jgi:hypothetical protein
VTAIIEESAFRLFSLDVGFAFSFRTMLPAHPVALGLMLPHRRQVRRGYPAARRIVSLVPGAAGSFPIVNRDSLSLSTQRQTPRPVRACPDSIPESGRSQLESMSNCSLVSTPSEMVCRSSDFASRIIELTIFLLDSSVVILSISVWRFSACQRQECSDSPKRNTRAKIVDGDGNALVF